MKERLDVLLVKEDWQKAERRQRCHNGRHSLCGRAADRQTRHRRGYRCEIEIKGESLPFVSRGGLKLAKPWQSFLSRQRKDSSRYWRINRRLHRLPAAERRG